MLTIKSKRGISELIGGAIVFTILFTTILSYFLVISGTNHDYQTTAILRSISDRDRGMEAFQIGTSPSSGKIGAFFNNTGALPITIVALFVQNSTHNFFFNDSSTDITPRLPLYLNPFSQSQLFDTGILFTSGTIYELKALTSRGQLGGGSFPEAVSASAVVSNVVGFITINAATLEWAEWSNGDTPSTVTWINDFNIPFKKDLVWRGIFENHNVDDLYLSTNSIASMIRAIPKGSTEVRMEWFYTMDPADFGALTDFTLIIPAGSSTTLMFGPINKGAGMSTSEAADFDFKGQYPVTLLIYGRWASPSGVNYGQNIPFTGVIVP